MTVLTYTVIIMYLEPSLQHYYTYNATIVFETPYFLCDYYALLCMHDVYVFAFVDIYAAAYAHMYVLMNACVCML